MENLKNNRVDEGLSFIEFINKTKEGEFSGKESIPEEYIIRYDVPDDIVIINEMESVEQYHFGLTD